MISYSDVENWKKEQTLAFFNESKSSKIKLMQRKLLVKFASIVSKNEASSENEGNWNTTDIQRS